MTAFLFMLFFLLPIVLMVALWFRRRDDPLDNNLTTSDDSQPNKLESHKESRPATNGHGVLNEDLNSGDNNNSLTHGASHEIETSYFSLDGRINRQAFFLWLLFYLVIGTLISQIINDPTLLLVMAVIVLCFSLTPVVKRFHDLNHSGWWAITAYIPLISIIPTVYLLFWRGTSGPNRYGKSPIGNADAPTVANNQAEFDSVSTPRDSALSGLARTSLEINVNHGQFTSLAEEVNEHEIYEAIAKELELGTTDKGLWTRLFSDCEGDEKQTKVRYIKRRAEDLIAVSRLRLENDARNLRQQAAEIEAARYVQILDRIKREFSSAEQVNAFDSHGLTPLMVAIIDKNELRVRALLDLGAEPDKWTQYNGRLVSTCDMANEVGGTISRLVSNANAR